MEEKINGACFLELHDKCPLSAEGFMCTCSCHKTSTETFGVEGNGEQTISRKKYYL